VTKIVLLNLLTFPRRHLLAVMQLLPAIGSCIILLLSNYFMALKVLMCD